jgi:hypothetical protein
VVRLRGLFFGIHSIEHHDVDEVNGFRDPWKATTKRANVIPRSMVSDTSACDLPLWPTTWVGSSDAFPPRDFLMGFGSLRDSRHASMPMIRLWLATAGPGPDPRARLLIDVLYHLIHDVRGVE